MKKGCSKRVSFEYGIRFDDRNLFSLKIIILKFIIYYLLFIYYIIYLLFYSFKIYLF